MTKNNKPTNYHELPKAKTFTSAPIPLKITDPKKIHKADLEFEDIDHSGQSYEARVFLNNSKANDSTPTVSEHGYAGSFFIFAHGGQCYGGPGHCTVPSDTNIYDLRTGHPLTPGYALVRITSQLKKAISNQSKSVIVTVVPIAMSYNEMADMENLLKFKKLRLTVYDR